MEKLDYEMLLYLADRYYFETGDEVFNKYFDKDNKSNVSLKIDALQWALDNKKNVTDYQGIEITDILDNYPLETMWDL